VTTLEMADAYATLASGGVRHRPTGIERVVFPDGKSEDLSSGEGKRVLTDGEAAAVTKVLKMNVQAGTGTAANYGCPAAGKTGTTDEAKDAWFVGFTPHLSAAVWVGYPDAGIAMPGAQGGTYAAPVWHDFMQAAHGEDCDDFPLPEHPAVLHSYFGKYAATGQPITPSETETDGDSTKPPTGGASPDQKFDPRYYEQAPQNGPNVEVPTTPPPPDQGGDTPGAQ
jgi:penicillin-binding protein 1A